MKREDLRRLFGAAPALLGSLLLASNVVQVWFARYPVSETMSQFLIFLGLLAFLHWEERGGAAFAAIAGTALGLSLLVRIDSLLIALPVGLYLLARRPGGPGLAPGARRWFLRAGLCSRLALVEVHHSRGPYWAGAVGDPAGTSSPSGRRRGSAPSRAPAGPRSARRSRRPSCSWRCTPTSCGHSSRPGPAVTGTRRRRRSRTRGRS
jgi:hypothetical protein